jgi:A/G-specific adenine glycosylase
VLLDEAHAAVLDWYAGHGRDLPWRHTRDPYAVLVSEVMLQQTQVSRVIERWREWLERWPAVEDLAATPTAELVRAWSGLGYNRRAVMLGASARAVVERGGFPRDVEGLQSLPGVGPYTARAIACFAFGAQVSAPDTNARRVLERAVGTPDADPPCGRAYEWNQALFDLGATVCLARVPRCDHCPLAHGCPSRGTRFAPLRRQGPLAGSRRETRARVVRSLHGGPRPAGDYDRAIVESLRRDGLVVAGPRGTIALPEDGQASRSSSATA